MWSCFMNPYQAYNRANHTVPKTKQVVMLYDGIIRNLQQAADAMEQNNIEERYKKLVKASEIIIGLQSCLDYEQGESAAQVLYDFYSSLDARIIGLHRSNDIAVCRELINEVKEMRGLWNDIDQGNIDHAGNEVVSDVEAAETVSRDGSQHSPIPETSNTDHSSKSGVAVSA